MPSSVICNRGTVKKATATICGIALCGVVMLCLVSCTKVEEKPVRPNRTESMMGKTLTETIAEHRQHLLSLPGVLKVEAGDCDRDSCIRVYVAKKTSTLINQIPPMIETWQVEIVESEQ